MKTLFALMLGLSLAACFTPVSGTRCDAGVAYCSSSTAALSCQGGTLTPYACTGPKGCTLGTSRAVLCDQSAGAPAGSPCFPEYEGKGQCSTDRLDTLVCRAGTWVAAACPLGQACHLDMPAGVVCR